jgi:hypothetical protein
MILISQLPNTPAHDSKKRKASIDTLKGKDNLNKPDSHKATPAIGTPAPSQQPAVSAPYCPGGICPVGPINGNPTVNNYGVAIPPPSIAIISTNLLDAKDVVDIVEGPLSKNPGVHVVLKVSTEFQNPTFIIHCNRPCYVTDGSVYPGISMAKKILTVADHPELGVMAFTEPHTIEPDQKVSIFVRSADSKELLISDVTPYVGPLYK